MTVPQHIEHQTDAWIPHKVIDGRPVNPCAPTGNQQRPRHRGERKNADAAVTCRTYDGQRWILLAEPAGRRWSLPGGGLHPGEHVRDAATRELLEETGYHVPPRQWTFLGGVRYVDDDRADDEGWYVTVICHHDLDTVDAPPPVVGGSDARQAAWVRAGTYIQLVDDLATRFGGAVSAAHRPFLIELLAPTRPELLAA